MERYEASRNNTEEEPIKDHENEYNDVPSIKNSEEEKIEGPTPEQIEEFQKQQATEKVVDIAGDLALQYFTGVSKDQLTSIPVVGGAVNDAWNGVVKESSKIVSQTPVGDMAKAADDTGLLDAAQTAKNFIDVGSGKSTDLSNIDPQKADSLSGDMAKPNTNSNTNLDTNSTSTSDTNLDLSNKKSNNKSNNSLFDLNKSSSGGMLPGNIFGSSSLKKYIILGACVFLFFMILIAVLMGDDFQNLALTNQENITLTSNASKTCTETELENKMIYVGDRRVEGIKSTLNNSNITYISSDSANLNWWNNLGLSQIENALNTNTDKFVVISLGLFDLNNIDSYITAYTDLINKYPNRVFISSINPVDETKTSMYSNVEIENFNKKLKDSFSNNYIDTYSSIGLLNSSDGITYDNNAYQSLHSNLVSNVSGTGKIMCSTGLSNIVYYNQNDYTQSYGYGSTIKSDGCGPVAMAMVISTLTGQTVTPIDTAKFSLDNGYKTNAGTSVNFMPAVASHYGLKSEAISLDEASITNALTQAKPIVMLVGPGIFTSRNHYIVLTGLSGDGKISIADPLSKEKSEQLWDLNTIISQGTGSLWAFSK